MRAEKYSMQNHWHVGTGIRRPHIFQRVDGKDLDFFVVMLTCSNKDIGYMLPTNFNETALQVSDKDYRMVMFTLLGWL